MDAIYVLLTLPLIAMALGYAWREGRHSVRIFTILRNGNRAAAEVVEIREDTDGDGDPKYIPVVIFTLPEGPVVRTESTTGTAKQCSLASGMSVQVRYNPAKPTEIFIEGYDSVLEGVILSVVAAISIAIAAVLLCNLRP
ncbi:DUF3592 domain-containing protein [Streptomyces sp. T-3]|nr:DUF3592 domain-containing protein [Streptomyces sp. T-3]